MDVRGARACSVGPGSSSMLLSSWGSWVPGEKKTAFVFGSACLCEQEQVETYFPRTMDQMNLLESRVECHHEIQQQHHER